MTDTSHNRARMKIRGGKRRAGQRQSQIRTAKVAAVVFAMDQFVDAFAPLRAVADRFAQAAIDAVSSMEEFQAAWSQEEHVASPALI